MAPTKLCFAGSQNPRSEFKSRPGEFVAYAFLINNLWKVRTKTLGHYWVFFSSHQIAEVERIADRVCIIDHGRLLVDASLDDIRREYRRITLSFEVEPPTTGVTFPGVQQVRTSGRQMTLLARENANAILELTRDMHPASVEVSPVGLREVFLETVKEQE